MGQSDIRTRQIGALKSLPIPGPEPWNEDSDKYYHVYNNPKFYFGENFSVDQSIGYERVGDVLKLVQEQDSAESYEVLGQAFEGIENSEAAAACYQRAAAIRVGYGGPSDRATGKAKTRNSYEIRTKPRTVPNAASKSKSGSSLRKSKEATKQDAYLNLIGESKKPLYDETGPSSSPAELWRGGMGDVKKHIDIIVASVPADRQQELRTSIEAAYDAAIGITTRGRGRQNAAPLPDWIEAHKQGVEIPEFIKDKFAAELADGSMHKGLFSRYENLRRDVYAYQRHHELPDWLAAIPKESEWNDQQAAAGKLLPSLSIGPRADQVRAYNRDLKRIVRAQQRKGM